MTTTGEEISWKNARTILRNIGMPHLDWAHGAAVNIVRQSLNTRHRPTYHQQTFLEAESPALLAYLERLATSGDATGWRTIRDRIQYHAEFLRDCDMQPCARPWLAAIWHTLPELAGIGQYILDWPSKKTGPVPHVAPVVSETNGGATGDDGSGDNGGKSGSAGTAAKPRPLPRLALPVVAVVLTEAEKKALDLGGDTPAEADAKNDVMRDGLEGTDGPGGMKGPGGKR
jgi:hypothetical protein